MNEVLDGSYFCMDKAWIICTELVQETTLRTVQNREYCLYWNCTKITYHFTVRCTVQKIIHDCTILVQKICTNILYKYTIVYLFCMPNVCTVVRTVFILVHFCTKIRRTSFVQSIFVYFLIMYQMYDSVQITGVQKVVQSS